ncbi:glycoside hydrolase family 25 protein [Mesorhizobium calcicola]|uniref:Glycoside hydrolase family 25 protein n=1 Tax=Mesorhizobium calcicola TaxID=1300310 RepID=A0ABW4WNM5_9HYPH
MRKAVIAIVSAAALFYPGVLSAEDVSGASVKQDVEGLEPIPEDEDVSREALFELVKEAAEAEDTGLAAEVQKFSLYGPFLFPTDTTFDVIENTPRKDSIFGIDLSHHNKNGFPFKNLDKRRVKFAFVKATQGKKYIDPMFQYYWEELGKVKVHRGAYHFLSAGVDAAGQAKAFSDVLQYNGKLKAVDMPPVMDLEWDKAKADAPDRWANVPPKSIIASAKTWLKAVEQRTGRRPMIYTARAWWNERIGSAASFSEFKDYKIWIADYSKSSRGKEIPKVPENAGYALWQFTDSSKLAQGYTGGFDANVFKGTEDEFYMTFGVDKF